jgi:ActR/RegA family two-component response regulator
MEELRTKLETIIVKFSGQISILLIEDDKRIQNAIELLLTSPLTSIYTADSQKSAISVIEFRSPWHCWVMDICMDMEFSGLYLLEKYPNFPFKIILSGMQSMSIASKAIQLGALHVFDKDPDSINQMHKKVCKTAILGFLLNGKNTKNLDLFSLLCDNTFANAEEWAQAAYITVRQLERICSLHSELTPRLILALYYSLEYLLVHEISVEILNKDTLNVPQFVVEHIDVLIKNIKRY